MGLLPTVTGKPGSVVVAVGDDRLYTFDAEGRLFSALVGGHTFRRGLDNRVLEKWSGPRHPGAAPWQGRRRRWLSRDEALAFLDGIYGDLRRVRTRVRAERGPGDGGSGWWDRALAWDAAGLEADGRRFREVYEPVGILPPDQYLSVVVQATVGCSYNRCTFCDFYRGQAFRIKSPAEFREHLKGVRAFFGAALAGRRWLFCGEGNALAVPAGPLAELLRAAGEAFPVAPAELDGPGLSRWLADRPVGFAGFAGFLDAIGGTRQPVEDLAVLRSLGLRRAYVGLETGHQPLRRLLGKPGTGEHVRRTVASLRAAGIASSVIVMLGVGGRQFAAGHVRDTLRVLEEMGLGASDMVYLSPFVDRPGTEYGQRAAEAGVEPLTEAEVADQYRTFVAALRRSGSARVAVYDIREFVY